MAGWIAAGRSGNTSPSFFFRENVSKHLKLLDSEQRKCLAAQVQAFSTMPRRARRSSMTVYDEIHTALGALGVGAHVSRNLVTVFKFANGATHLEAVIDRRRLARTTKRVGCIILRHVARVGQMTSEIWVVVWDAATIVVGKSMRLCGIPYRVEGHAVYMT